MNGKLHRPKAEPYNWDYRVLCDGKSAVIEYGDKSIALLTGDDPPDGERWLPSEEFVVPKDFAKRLCNLLNELEWYPDE